MEIRPVSFSHTLFCCVSFNLVFLKHLVFSTSLFYILLLIPIWFYLVSKDTMTELHLGYQLSFYQSIH